MVAHDEYAACPAWCSRHSARASSFISPNCSTKASIDVCIRCAASPERDSTTADWKSATSLSRCTCRSSCFCRITTCSSQTCPPPPPSSSPPPPPPPPPPLPASSLPPASSPPAAAAAALLASARFACSAALPEASSSDGGGGDAEQRHTALVRALCSWRSRDGAAESASPVSSSVSGARSSAHVATLRAAAAARPQSRRPKTASASPHEL